MKYNAIMGTGLRPNGARLRVTVIRSDYSAISAYLNDNRLVEMRCAAINRLVKLGAVLGSIETETFLCLDSNHKFNPDEVK